MTVRIGLWGGAFGSVMFERHRVGPLDCLVRRGDDALVPVVILHGYGASAENLAPLAMPWIASLGDVADRFEFIFPDAPQTLESLGMPDGRAWWPINMSTLMAKMQTGRFADLHDEVPPGMEEARAAIVQCVESATERLGADRYVIGGFSQGAMGSMDVALRGDVPPPAALFQLSGTLICQTRWSECWDRLRQTRIVQSHGTLDPVLPHSSAVALRDLMTDAGLDVTFCSFPGPHTVGGDAVERCGEVLRSLVPG